MYSQTREKEQTEPDLLLPKVTFAVDISQKRQRGGCFRAKTGKVRTTNIIIREKKGEKEKPTRPAGNKSSERSRRKSGVIVSVLPIMLCVSSAGHILGSS